MLTSVTTVTNLTSRCYPTRKGHHPVFIGIHTMEAPELPNTAENVANYFKTVDASSHWTVDNNSRDRVVPDESAAWTMPPVNNDSYNIEIAGYAKQTPEDWADEYSINALEIAALCAAEWVVKDGIPIQHLSDDQIRAMAPGFVGHVDVNRVFKASSHTDPGAYFPWDYFLGRVTSIAIELGLGPAVNIPNPVPQAPIPNWNNLGYSTAWISAQQRKLNALGYGLDVDGKLGQHTHDATVDFQSKHGLVQDGIPGPKTSAALDVEIASRNAPHSRPNCVALQAAVHTATDNAWGDDTDKHFDALRASSNWGGNRFPYGVKFAQEVVGTDQDGDWGNHSKQSHNATVIAVQRALTAMGFDTHGIDGIWGDHTEAAYQAARSACHI